MADWQVSDDRRSWTFTLRENLRFHDNVPRPCAGLHPQHPPLDGARQLRPGRLRLRGRHGRAGRPPLPIRLKRPFAFLADAIGRSQGPAFIMPERFATADPHTAIRDATGSGPLPLRGQ
jgi:peptide/nickel transport system substrate-binding protein